MKQDDINKLTDLTNLHIRLSEAINMAASTGQSKPIFAIQQKVADEMQKIANPLVVAKCARCAGGLPRAIDPSKIKVVKISTSKEGKPARRKTRGLGIR